MRSGAAAKRTAYTWDDYQTWDDDQRWEIIGGEAYAMTPAPATRHQAILQELAWQLGNFFRRRPCKVFPAPTDVKFSEEDVVQPDINVVCDQRKIKSTHIEGAPALIIEILSPSTALLDRTRKMRLYARHRVKEVWLVTPYPWLVEVFLLDSNTYRLSAAFSKEDTLTSPTFRGLRIDLRRVFDFRLEPGEKIPMVKEGHPPYRKRKSRPLSD